MHSQVVSWFNIGISLEGPKLIYESSSFEMNRLRGSRGSSSCVGWLRGMCPYENCNSLSPTRGDHSLLYFAYTCVRDLFIGGVIYLAENIIRWWYFTCKKPKSIICDGMLHVNMFHYFKIPYFTSTFFTKFTYIEYIGPYFLSHVVLPFSLVISPSSPKKWLSTRDYRLGRCAWFSALS
jgi:hypothetical protein